MASVPVPNVSNVTMFGPGGQRGLARGLARQSLGIAGAGDPINVTIVVQGMATVAEHFATLIPLTDSATRSLLGYSGDLMANLMKEIHKPNIRTGDTFRSIGVADGGVVAGLVGEYSIAAGPETPQSIFLEFGFLHRQSGRYIAYPFVFPAGEAVAPLFIQGMEQIATFGDRLIPPAGPGSEPLTSIFDRFRSGLYSFSKAAGDLAVLGIDLPGRGIALGTARILGDIQSGMRGAIARRITVRAVGSFAAFGLRARVSAVATGPSSQYISAANRLYNRFAGAATGRSIREVFGGIP